MQTPATDQSITSPSGPPNFAGILASVTDPPWNDDGLADDVASISYEQALRTHARFPSASPERDAQPDLPKVLPAEPTSDGKRLKTASITIRLSGPECAQVRQRAAEAGLTVSAYLRSCALEVESLRAQVKDTLAQLRSSPGLVQENPAAEPGPRSRILAQLWSWYRKRFPNATMQEN